MTDDAQKCIARKTKGQNRTDVHAAMADRIICFYRYALFLLHMAEHLPGKFTTSGIRTEFVGFQWYIEALRNDVNFMPKMLSTLKFIVFLSPMILVVSVVFALLLNKAMRGRSFFRALFFLPVVFINGPVMSKLIGNDATAIIKPEKYAFYQIIETLPGAVSVPLLYILEQCGADSLVFRHSNTDCSFQSSKG